MKVELFKVRCFICFKGFEIPRLPDSLYGEHFFINHDTWEFRYFSWHNSSEVSNTVEEALKQSFELRCENDNTKGNTTLKLIGKLADGNYEPILGAVKCPRCSLRIQSFPNYRTTQIEVESLTFQYALSLEKPERLKLLLAR